MKESKESNGSIAVRQEASLAAVILEKAISLLQEEFAHEPIPWGALGKIKVPAAGTTVWTLDEGEYLPTFEGIIVYSKPMRTYWEGGFTGESRPPDCYSLDLVVGLKGRCAKCPFSRFGSALQGRGQACKQIQLLAIAREGSILPRILILPPTSLANFSRYRLQLIEKGLTVKEAVTRFGLIHTKSSTGIVYSQVTFDFVAPLSTEQQTAVRAMAEALSGLQIGITLADMPDIVGSNGTYHEEGS
jgi:hypothetical protein